MLVGFVGLFVNFTWGVLLIGAIGIFAINILITLYLSKAPKQIWSALWGLPLFVLNQFKGLLKMGNPNKNFKHSEHTRKVSIDEVMKQGTHNE